MNHKHIINKLFMHKMKYLIKSIILFMFITGFLPKSMAQDKLITLKLTNTTLKEVIWELEKLSDVTFFYNSEDVAKVKIPSLEIKGKLVTDVLQLCLKNTDLQYEVNKGVIVIKKKVSTPTPKQPKEISVKGRVMDQKGEELIGVGILVKGTLIGTYTDLKGNYEIKVPSENDTLIYMYIGMEEVQAPIRGKNMINIVMTESAKELGEVVVTGYGNVAKEAYTGSALVIDAPKIGSRAVSSFENALRGLSPGTIVTGSGQPGEERSIRLRGVGSMNATNQPLYVIDGVVWDQDNLSGNEYTTSNPISALNPSDIANITILKDAASASLYGSRGANGVIVITTKQGVAEEDLRISVNIQGGVTKMTGQPSLVNGEEYAQLWTEGQMNYRIQQDIAQSGVSGTTALYGALVSELTKLYDNKLNYLYNGKNYYEWQQIARKDFNSLYQMPTSEGYYRNYDYFNTDMDKLPSVNWFKVISRDAPFTKVNVTLRGGGKNLKYYTSLEYFNQQGTIINSELKRYALRMKLTSDSKKKLVNWGLNTYLVNTQQSGPLAGGLAYNSPQYAAAVLPSVVPAKLEDGTYNYFFPENLLNSNHNPVASANLNVNEKPLTNINVSGWLQLNLTDWLKFKSTGSLYYLGLRRRAFYDRDFGTGFSREGELTERDVHRRKLSSTNLLFIDKRWGVRHSINVSLGTEVEDLSYKYNQVTVNGFASNDIPYISNSTIMANWSGAGYANSMFSLMSKVDYSYLNRYYLSSSFRRDYSSMFSPEYRAGNFWSISGAYDLAKEKFMRVHNRLISMLKVKGSYGVTGTLPDDRYYWRDTYQTTRYMNTPGAYSNYRFREDLTWEGNRIWNIGIDAGLLKNKLKISAEYYQRKSKDLLQNVKVSMASGYETMLANTSAGINNKGFEIDINYIAIDKKDLVWDVNFNISSLSSKYYGIQSPYLDSRSRQLIDSGQSLYAWYVKEYAGIEKETGLPLYKAYREDGTPYLTTSITESAYKVAGKGIPSMIGGLASSLSWKNWSLNMLFSFAWGHHIYDRLGASIISNDGAYNYSISTTQLDRWNPDNTSGTAPLRINYSSPTTRTTRYLIKGDYFKLKNIRLEYKFPREYLAKMKLNNVSAFIQAEDPLIITKMKDYDPEMTLDGYRNPDAYPSGSTYTIGLNINF